MIVVVVVVVVVVVWRGNLCDGTVCLGRGVGLWHCHEEGVGCDGQEKAGHFTRWFEEQGGCRVYSQMAEAKDMGSCTTEPMSSVYRMVDSHS